MVGLLTLGAGVGIDVTVTVLVAIPVQVPTVQIAIYDDVVAGLTVREVPLIPSFHVTVPGQFDTTRVVKPPLQILGLLTAGVGFVHKQLLGALYVVVPVQEAPLVTTAVTV